MQASPKRVAFDGRVCVMVTPEQRQKRPNIGSAAWQDQNLAKSAVNSADLNEAHFDFFELPFLDFFFAFAITLLLRFLNELDLVGTVPGLSLPQNNGALQMNAA